MSLELEPLDVSELGHLEFGQYVKEQTSTIDQLPAGTITDAGLQLGINAIKDKSNDFDKSMVKVTKNQLTDDVTASDKKRDDSNAALGAAIGLGLKSDVAEERDAAENLQSLYESYGGTKISIMNLEKESNAIDNLIVDLESKTYAADVDTLSIGKYVDRLKKDNTAFKNIFSQRLKGEVGKPHYDAIVLRKELGTGYSDFAGYVLYNAKLQGTSPQFAKVLDVLNVTRKYYSNLIATRKGKKKANKNKNKREDDGKDEPKLPPQ